ncbi:MAG TPA: ABC transporter ATP-binding protein [Desulfosporosinus sp.]|nr:ABC transporter ATP-binding protein [Desulfosporosinus sp.]
MIKTNVMEIKNLNVSLKTQGRDVPVVKNVSFNLYEGKVLGLIGESGCGKSATCLSIMGLLERDRWNVAGSIALNGQAIQGYNQEKVRRLRGGTLSMIMQNPIGSFNPLITLGEHFIETIRCHKTVSKKEAQQIALEMLSKINLPQPQKIMKQYPFQLSGGMLQRVMIAIALFMRPSVLIADEPTTSLDVTVQYQILGELSQLRDNYKTSMLLVSHDLGIIAQMADNVAVMYGGYIVEKASILEIFHNTLHPYTRALMQSKPSFTKNRLNVLEGYPPSIMQIKAGCPFAERCSYVQKDCQKFEMSDYDLGSHTVRCLLYASAEEAIPCACS